MQMWKTSLHQLLKKYSVNVAGVVLDGVGIGKATGRQSAGGPWPVTVE